MNGLPGAWNGGPSQRIVIVSDLHVAAEPGEGEEVLRDVRAFVGFLGWLAARRPAPRLLFLGDLFDFYQGLGRTRPGRFDTSTEASVIKLERILHAHRDLLDVLRTLASSGVPIHIVPGNHDVDLARPAVQARFRDLVVGHLRPEARKEAIAIHPWLWYVPGFLYAEHGHQYHDVNRFAALLALGNEDRHEHIDLPLAPYLFGALAALRRAGRRAPSPTPGDPTLPEILRAIASHPSLRSRRRQASARGAYQERLLGRHQAELGLPIEVVAAIDEAAAATRLAMAWRLGRSALAAALGSGGRTEGYLHAGAAAVHTLLEARGVSVPFYAFGHTHLAEVAPMSPGNAFPEYVNAGTWASKHDPPPGIATLHPFVEVSRGPEGAEARIEVWDDALQRGAWTKTS